MSPFPTTDARASWTDLNQRYLTAALRRVRLRLERHTARGDEREQDVDGYDAGLLEALAPETTAVERLTQIFGLSPFERDVLLLCAGMELEASFAGLCAEAQGDPQRTFPTFGLALATLDEPHWSALTPEAPLRRWRLIEMANQPPALPTTAPLRIDERILHFLAGIQYLDDRLAALLEPVPVVDDLVPSHRAIARRIAIAWTRVAGVLPIVQLSGADPASKRAIAVAGCADIGLRLFALPADFIPTNAGELDGLIRLWEREAVLTSSALYVEAETLDMSDVRAVATVTHLLERSGGALLIGTRERWKPSRRPTLSLDVEKPTAEEQRQLWRKSLDQENAQANSAIEQLVGQFDLTAPTILAAAREALASTMDGRDLPGALWDAARAQARPRLDDLAQRIRPAATWDDLVLPDMERRLLHDVAAQVAHRTTVYEAWGFGNGASRGLGISALFAGPSGTGKTMAAEVVAGTLHLDLYRIDLSSVVSKYVGETEKNLRRVFDAAEDGGAILFFDEADALFGKRSEVKDSHDRYANVEINYLLQRMELYRGLAILATNAKSSLDPAFLRRIRFIVNFPFPDTAQRMEIWRRVFPSSTPTEGLDLAKLARLNVAGGNIRNIALNAAFLAAGRGEPVRMGHILRAARAEYAKLEKPLTDAEIGGWQ